MTFYISPSYSTNIFEMNIDNLNKVFVLMIPSIIMNTSISLMKKLLSIYIHNNVKYKKKCFISLVDKHLVILSSDQDLMNELLNLVYEQGLKNQKEKLLQYFPFNKIPREKQSIAFKALAKGLRGFIFQTLFNKGWTILRNRRVYKNSDTYIINLPDPIDKYVKVYRGIDIYTSPVTVYNLFSKERELVGLIIDPVLVIEPCKTLGEMFDEGLVYKGNKVVYKKIMSVKKFFNYSLIIYEIWDIIEMNINSRALKAVRMVKRKDSWTQKCKDFNLYDLFVPRRPEVIDDMLKSKYKINKYSTLTRIIKKESFQITEEGKRDIKASYKRYILTKKFIDIINPIIKKSIFLDTLKIMINPEPLRITTI